MRAGARDVIIMSVLMNAGKKARADKEEKKKQKKTASAAAARSAAANRFGIVQCAIISPSSSSSLHLAIRHEINNT